MSLRHTQLICILLAAPFVAGCGEQPNAAFVWSERTLSLMPEAQRGFRAEKIPGVRKWVDDNFGTPTDLLAWQRLPVNWGGFEGVVVEKPTDAPVVMIKVSFSEDVPATGETELTWLSGKAAGTAITILGFDSESSRISAELSGELPEVGDTFVLDLGHQLKQGRMVYAEHCVHCHGTSGDGDGPTAKYLNPRPRDYRLGRFKYKSTIDAARPTRDDLNRIIKHGVPGTYMPSFLLLGESETRAAVEYVRWLSMRGEFERRLSAELAGEYSTKAYKNKLRGDTTREEILAELKQVLTEDMVGIVDSSSKEIAAAWEESHDGVSGTVTSFPEEAKADESAPSGPRSFEVELDGTPREGAHQLIHVLDGKLKSRKLKVISRDAEANKLSVDFGKVGGLSDGDRFRFDPSRAIREGLIPVAPRVADSAESRDIGRKLFMSKEVKCVNCHGASGRGNGPQTHDFAKNSNDDNKLFPEPGLHDVWGNTVQPRDLTSGIYRGGRRPIDIYRRIRGGITASQMPPHGENILTDEQVWHVINYVLSIPLESK
ncbi:MAG: cytochrome c [Planctomycetota bacterium]|nr:cytochrome c [Planctomycetota bacterium]